MGDVQEQGATRWGDDPAESGALLPGTIDEYDPMFLGLLTRAANDAGLLPYFSEWLQARGDCRAALVNDLAAPAVMPAHIPVHGEECPIVAARYWTAVRCRFAVRARVFSGTPLAVALATTTAADRSTWPRTSPATRVEIAVPFRVQTLAALYRAVECCRRSLLLALFGTSPRHLGLAEDLAAAATTSEAIGLLRRRPRSVAVPALLTLRAKYPARFGEVLIRLQHDPSLSILALMVRDRISPAWRGLPTAWLLV